MVDTKDDPWYYELYPDYSQLNVRKMNYMLTRAMKWKKEEDVGENEPTAVEGDPVRQEREPGEGVEE